MLTTINSHATVCTVRSSALSVPGQSAAESLVVERRVYPPASRKPFSLMRRAF